MEGFRVFAAEPFGELFASVFPHLEGLSWLSLCGAFEYPSSWADASSFDERLGRYVSGPLAEFERDFALVEEGTLFGKKTYGSWANANIFPRYAGLVSEDWTSIFGVRTRPDDPKGWFAGYYGSSDRVAYLAERCEVVFLNVDGAFWEIFSRDAGLLARYSAWLDSRLIRHESKSLSGCRYYL